MIEIKFRAWYEKEKRLLSWDELQDGTESLQTYFNNELSDVSPLMQYTGLKDKNGVEIYEEDIITWRDKPIFSNSEKSEKLKDIIVFEDGCFRAKIYNELLSNLARIEKTGFKFNYLAHHETEVIGNIYENPELLEGEK